MRKLLFVLMIFFLSQAVFAQVSITSSMSDQQGAEVIHVIEVQGELLRLASLSPTGSIFIAPELARTCSSLRVAKALRQASAGSINASHYLNRCIEKVAMHLQLPPVITIGNVEFRTLRNKRKQWYWRARAKNNRGIATSGESFYSRANAERAMRNFIEALHREKGQS